ncbi:ROK family protein [Vagococcus salmoninarum]|uniref:ROK family protein n=1 Tax=Vagococcus salmoninarum TaxID=2739 RepID=UPI001880EFCE|nr:ROK family protein [Vagococcus salmoninarum]MBE9388636.1 ROK family protein [Vagococcus salmoninarum]
MTTYICIDIGGSAVKHALINTAGVISTTGEVPTPTSLETFIATIKDIQAIYQDTQTKGIAISMPGLVDSDTGHVIHGGALTFIQNLNIRDLLQEACHVPVEIENDGKSAALGEHWLGNLQGVENGIALVIGTGIGGGIIVHNKLLRGHHLGAGEFSYMRTNSESNDFNYLFAVQGSSQILSNTYAEIKGLKEQDMNGKLFFEDVNNDLPDATSLLNSYTEKLAKQLMNLQTILDPEIITIGGGISSQERLFTSLNKHIDEIVSSFPLPLIKPTVKQSSLGNKANLLGALANFQSKVGE